MDETPLTDPTQAEIQHSHKLGRAVFLGALAAGVSSLYWGRAAWSRVSSVISPIENAIPLIPTGGWRIYAVSGSLPKFDPKTWRLTIGGHVRARTVLDYQELLALPKVEQVSTFHCVTGWTVKNVTWGGVRLNDVLGPAQPTDTAKAMQFVSMEHPYVDYLTNQQAGLHDVMLAYEMEGKPLSRAHGAPVRLIIPEMYGYKNVKWLTGINMISDVEQTYAGYWEELGYDRDAWVGHSNGYGT
jgi:DMSO/TMAO reductase YedYZ molybdopterin-dependent catalytic subunit